MSWDAIPARGGRSDVQNHSGEHPQLRIRVLLTQNVKLESTDINVRGFCNVYTEVCCSTSLLSALCVSLAPVLSRFLRLS